MNKAEDSPASFFVNFTGATPYAKGTEYAWGDVGNNWWGNLTCLSTPENCATVNLPTMGSLVVVVADSSGHGESLIGLYSTKIDNVLVREGGEGGGEYTTNITCMARYEMTQTEDFADFDGIDEYEVDLYDEEIWCDLNQSLWITEDYLEMISLRPFYTTIAMDPQFDTIFWFDPNDWCHAFSLTHDFAHDSSRDAS